MSRTAHSEPFASKASMVRGYVTAMRRAGLFDDVRRNVSPQVARMLDDPPPASVWVRWQDTEEIVQAIERVGGLAAVRRLSRDGVLQGLIPILRVTIEGFLRLFGATPNTIFSRTGQLIGLSSRGVSYVFRAKGETSGTMVVTWHGRRELSQAALSATAGGLEAVYDLCGTRGTVSDGDWLSDGSATQFECLWERGK